MPALIQGDVRQRRQPVVGGVGGDVVDELRTVEQAGGFDPVIGAGALRQVAAVEKLEQEILGQLGAGMAQRWRELEIRLHIRAGSPLPRGNQLVFQHVGVDRLREAIGVLQLGIQAVEEQLVAELHAVVQFMMEVEVGGEGVGGEKILGVDQHVLAREPHFANAGRIERERGIGAARPEAVDRPGGSQAGREHECRQPAGGDDLGLRQPAALVGVQIQQRRAGEVSAVVDQILAQAVPAGILVAVVVVVLHPELDPGALVDVAVERRLQHALAGAVVAVVTVGVFVQAVQVVAHRRGIGIELVAVFGFDHRAIPGAGGERHFAHRLVEVGAAFGARRLGNEIDVAADLGRAVDRRRRATHDVEAIRRGDGRGDVAGVIDPAHAAKIILARRAADIDGARDTEKRAGEGAGRQRGDVVEVADIEQIDQLGADAGQRAWGVLDAHLEAGDRIGFALLQQVAAIDHLAGDFNAGKALAVGFGSGVLGEGRAGKSERAGDGKAKAVGVHGHELRLFQRSV